MRYEKISAAKPEKPHVDTDLSEEVLLRHQAESAMSAIHDLLGKIQGDMAHAADPREWAERYPWATVAVAAAAGFAAATTIASRKAAPPASAAPPPSNGAARSEAYVRGEPRTRPEPEPAPPPQESHWTPLVEMAKVAASKYLMSIAQTGIAAFAASRAAAAAAHEDSQSTDSQAAASDRRTAGDGETPDVVPT
ncbi:MAG: hypothetical protein K8U03_14065 [Planctomycetia bacterium]|nr:hypothetical protein [Planctomycetia bacterium]